MSERTRPSTEVIRRGRLKKAIEFLDGAILIDDDMPDAAVSLLVNAGIAAADVICGVRLGMYATGENHNEAVALLAKADAGAEKAPTRAMECQIQSVVQTPVGHDR